MKTLILSKQDIAECVSPLDFLQDVEFVFREWGKGNVIQPAKITLDMSKIGTDSWSNAMPAYIIPLKIAGIKWAGGYSESSKQGLPYIMASIILTDPKTGHTLAFMEGGLITNYRTGASAAISAKYLGRKNINKIAIIGAGAQGRTCVTCLSYLYKNAEVRVADISVQKRKSFKKEMEQKLGMNIIEANTIKEAVQEADIIVLVTAANEPLVKHQWVKTGATVLAMGSYPQIEEAFTLQADKIIVDSWEQSSHRGELLPLVQQGKINVKNIYAELGEIVAGKKAGRESEEENILVVPIGLGAHDICVAHHVYQKAKQKGLGTFIDLQLDKKIEL
jgi:ornithine cyclodeaminase/alanine dehydrogenase